MSILRCENISLNSLNSKSIVQEINFELEANDFCILLGSNGSGKSSLLKLLTRLYMPNSGTIFLNNKPLTSYSNAELGCALASLSQDSQESLFSSLSVFENYLIIKKCYGQKLLNTEQERLYLKNYLADYNKNLPLKLDSIVDQLSGGERQALALALAFTKSTQLLLLDEHTSALDPKTSAQVMQLTHIMITKHNSTCILTTHDLDIALEYGNKILVLQEGRIKKIIHAAEKRALVKNDLLQYYL